MSPLKVKYQNQEFIVFDQIRVGRFQLFNAAKKENLSAIKDAWKKENLGKLYTVKPMPEHVIGEEILDQAGKLIAVFGLTITNAFTPQLQPQQKYLQTLTKLVENT
jgi:hypothetical protein